MLRLREVCDLPSLTAGSAGLRWHPTLSGALQCITVNVAQENHSAKVNPILWLLEAALPFSLDDFLTPLPFLSLFQPVWVQKHSSGQTGLVRPAPGFSTSEQLPQVGQTAAAGTAATVSQHRNPVGGPGTLLTTDCPGSFKCYYWKSLLVLFVIFLTLLRVIQHT